MTDTNGLEQYDVEQLHTYQEMLRRRALWHLRLGNEVSAGVLFNEEARVVAEIALIEGHECQ